MDLGLQNRVALVVGGTGRIGSATARQLVAEGATVVLAARDAGKLSALATELGVDSVVLDAGDDASVANAIDEVLARHGRIDVAVLTAAPPAATLDAARDLEAAHLLDAISGKSIGFLRVATALLPHMTAAGYGRIVGVSGQIARMTTTLAGAVRNRTLNTIAKTLADSAAGTGVTVNVVNPGPVLDETAHPAPERGRPGESSYADVAALIVFLTSQAAGSISGEEIAAGHKLLGVES
ncbi:SDR family NAD(P)-dependent oxidoreductase [uncultured Schumannella sp.]|uniref:SDR family NAD(P)-dependent oxidoreductase n=1 Tax=uncultured Schumannella sp. TaxID=1195956 RepID=UPI0025D8CF1D|nr:SDR family oxidoreductase [uncultured Schumannella sp.]